MPHEIPQTIEKEKTPFETLLESLKNDWDYNIKAMAGAGILETFTESDTRGVRGVDGKEYPVPETEEIQRKLEEKREMIEKKLEQGFTELLLVPFGMPLSKLTLRLKQCILRKHEEGTLISTDGTTLELDVTNPLHKYEEWTEDKIYYDIQSFNKNNHQGKTKAEILSVPNSAWQILLVEPNLDIPAQDKGQTIGRRKQLEANLSAEDYLNLIQNDPQYQNETSYSPEAILIQMLQKLQNDNVVINDYQGSGKITRCFNSMFASGNVPSACWNRGSLQASLHSVSTGDRRPDLGSRSSVRV